MLQQAPGYGPTNTTRHNPTTVRRYLASEDRWIDVGTTYYDTVGNVVQKKDALNRIVETIQYSAGLCYYAYPTQVTNNLGHSSFTNYLVQGFRIVGAGCRSPRPTRTARRLPSSTTR